jgi:hypothetical protein
MARSHPGRRGYRMRYYNIPEFRFQQLCKGCPRDHRASILMTNGTRNVSCRGGCSEIESRLCTMRHVLIYEILHLDKPDPRTRAKVYGPYCELNDRSVRYNLTGGTAHLPPRLDVDVRLIEW